jgi:hypothetical protein
VLRFLDSAGVAYDLGDDEFAFEMLSSDKKATADVLRKIIGDGLSVVDNEILISFDEDDTDIDRDIVFWQLKNLTTVQNWFQGKGQIVSGLIPEATSEVDQTINIGDNVVTVTMTIAGGSGGGITKVDLDVSAAIELDVEGEAAVLFTATTDIDGERDWSILDDDDSALLDVVANITGLHAQQFPLSFLMSDFGGVGVWDDQNKIWTPTRAGKYRIHGTKYNDEWWIEITGAFI